jgi:hypothetical protein
MIDDLLGDLPFFLGRISYRGVQENKLQCRDQVQKLSTKQLLMQQPR